MAKDVFKKLEPELKKLVAERFRRPTPIQELVIPEVLAGHNILSLSETGSGKTEACMLPIFDLWLRDKPKPMSILYITPLRSLNRDLMDRIMWWANHLEMDVSVRHGDTSQYERKMQAENPPDMLISTPETLQAILTGKLMREHLKNVRYVVLDEVHELVSNKRGLQLSVGLERLKHLIASSSAKAPVPQIIALSATIGSPEKVVKFFSLDRATTCKVLNSIKTKRIRMMVESPKPIKSDFSTAGRLHVAPETAARLRRITSLIKSRKAVLTFTNTREFAEVLSSRIKAAEKNLPVETHHSSLSKDVRMEAEKGFKKSEIKGLICTSSLELGIDIGAIDFVIQYQSPRQVAKFLQRVGRSGHSLSRTSQGIIISGESDDSFESTIITSLAREGWVEPTKMYGKSFDVLAHQILGLALEEYNIPAKKAYGIITRAYPFRDLTFEEFMETATMMQKLGLMWVNDRFHEEVVLRRKSRAFQHYYFNLSTIPDIKNYQVFDIISNKPVGTLDAEFIALHGSPGTSFICKGQAWRILDIGKSRINVEAIGGISAAIPAWEGELIPVPFEVAQGVGKLRREVKALSRKHKRETVIKKLADDHGINTDVAETLYDTIKRQTSYGFVPDDKRILVEYFTDGEEYWVIFNTCWGSLINETIGRTISSILTSKLGSVGLQTDPYRMVFRVQALGYWKEILDTFRMLKPETPEMIMSISVPNTELFTWRFIHVCKRFGIISRDAEYGKGYIRKILDVYRNTPPFREALNEVFQEKLDIPGSAEVIKSLNQGKLKLEIRKGPSPIGEMAIHWKYEIIAPDRPEREIFSIFKKRLLDTELGLVCNQCGNWGTIVPVKDFPKKPTCPRCGAGLISIVPRKYILEAQDLVHKRISRKKLTEEEESHLKHMSDTSSLVMASGKDAALALAGRGVGPRTASRILNHPHDTESLMREVLKAERKYAQTKRFWR